jgi:hypothetical protein
MKLLTNKEVYNMTVKDLKVALEQLEQGGHGDLEVGFVDTNEPWTHCLQSNEFYIGVSDEEGIVWDNPEDWAEHYDRSPEDFIPDTVAFH